MIALGCVLAAVIMLGVGGIYWVRRRARLRRRALEEARGDVIAKGRVVQLHGDCLPLEMDTELDRTEMEVPGPGAAVAAGRAPGPPPVELGGMTSVELEGSYPPLWTGGGGRAATEGDRGDSDQSKHG